MNLLIVDDEKYAIQGILDGVAWDKLEFKEVLTANSFAQAVELFEARRIDVLLCDIEMPMGSGLDLIEWAREHSPDTVNIILSCHDRFDFARQAVKLQCLDYVMKPATPEALLEALGKAIIEIKERRRQALLQEVGKQYAHIVAPAEEESAGRTSLAEQVAQYILAHIDAALTVEELANRFYVSADHLTRTFKKRYGKTIIQYIAEQRMFLAGELIQHTPLTITTIAEKVGYFHYPYFVKMFRKHYGMTPREYAQQYRK